MALFVLEVINPSSGEEGKVVIVANSGSEAQAEARRLGLTHSTIVRRLKGGNGVLQVLFSPAMIAVAALLAVGLIFGMTVGFFVSKQVAIERSPEVPVSKAFPPIIALGNGKALSISNKFDGLNRYNVFVVIDSTGQIVEVGRDSRLGVPGH